MNLRASLALAVALLSAPAAAEAPLPPPPEVAARLTYTVPPGCPPEVVLRGEFGRRRGYDPFVKEAPLLVVATIKRGKRSWDGLLEIYDSADKLIWSRPTSPDKDCLEVVEEMAGALSFRFDSRVSEPLVEPPPPPKPAPAPSPHPAPLPKLVEPSSPEVEPEPPQEPAPRPERRSTEFRFGLGSVLGFGVAPRAAVGLSADAGMRWRAPAWTRADGISVALGVRWDPSATGDASNAMVGTRVSTTRVLGTLAPCLHWWVMSTCALVGVGRLWGSVDEPTALHQAEAASPFYVATGGRIGVELPFAPHVGLRVSADLLGTWTPVTITIEGQSAWTASRVVGGLEAGLYVFN